MGKMLVTFHTAGLGGKSADNDPAPPLPVARLKNAFTENVTSSGTSARTVSKGGTFAQNPHDPDDGGFVTITAVGANIYIEVGDNTVVANLPSAGAVGPGFPVMSGQAVTFGLGKDQYVAGIEFA